MASDTAVYLLGLAAGYYVGFVLHSPTVDRMVKAAVKALLERNDGE